MSENYCVTRTKRIWIPAQMKGLLASILLLGTPSVWAVDASVLTEPWQHTSFELYLDAQEAYNMKKDNPQGVLFLDVRNQAEIHYTGMADSVDANIPYRFDSVIWKQKKDSPYGTFKKPKNPHFADAVENALKDFGLDKTDKVIIMCTSGSRAPFAADVLYEAGFKQVYTQIEGFEGVRAEKDGKKGARVVNGWKNRGFPWSYDLLPEKMYFNFDPLVRETTAESARSSAANNVN